MHREEAASYEERVTSKAAAQLLPRLFDAERAVRRAHAELVELSEDDGDAVAQDLVAAIDEAMALDDSDEMALRLVRVADVLAELEGPRVVDALIAILGCDEPEPRHAAGEALEGLAFDRFKEVALGVERALSTLAPGNPALAELPFILAEIPEPGVVKLLGKFLKHGDPEAVAAAIEALVEVGDPAGATLLDVLAKDTRQVQLDDEGGDDARVTLGELATEARAFLAEVGKGRGSGAPPGAKRGS